jgi:hypothetical protein
MIVPWILPIRIDDELLAKAFWIIPMTMRPGARKSLNGTPITTRPPRPNATVKMARKRRVVIAGAQTV